MFVFFYYVYHPFSIKVQNSLMEGTQYTTSLADWCKPANFSNTLPSFSQGWTFRLTGRTHAEQKNNPYFRVIIKQLQISIYLYIYIYLYLSISIYLYIYICIYIYLYRVLSKFRSFIVDLPWTACWEVESARADILKRILLQSII